MTLKLVHKSGYLPHVAYCGTGLGNLEVRGVSDRWAGVNCPACRRLVLDKLDVMRPGAEKDKLIDELLGLNWAKESN